MNRHLLHFLVVGSTLLAQTTGAAPVDHWFAKANGFYESKEYDSAITYYEEILESGTKNRDVYYNLGNAYFRRGKLGLALLNYELARKISPADQDILANIRFAQRTIIDRVPEPQRSFFETILWRLHTLFTLHAQLWLLFGFLLFLSLSFSLGLFASYNVRLWLIYVGSLVGILSVVLGISIGIKIYDAERKQFAIVLEKTVDAKNQPEGEKILFTVHEGTKFQIKKSVDNWSFVTLPNGVSGWVESSALGRM